MEFVGRRKSFQAASITPSPAQRGSPCTTPIRLRKICYKNNRREILPLSLTQTRAESAPASDPNTAPGRRGRRVLSRRGKESRNPAERAPQGAAAGPDSQLPTAPAPDRQNAEKAGTTGGYMLCLRLFYCIASLAKGGSKQESLDQGSTNIDVLFNLNPANIKSLMQGFLKYFQVKPFTTGGTRLCGDAIIIQNKALKAKETQNYH